MKVLRVKSVNGDTSFQNETLVVHSNDFIPIVELDLEQINSKGIYSYDGFEIEKGIKTTQLSRFLDPEKSNQKLHTIRALKNEIVVKFKVSQANNRATDTDGYIEIKPLGVDVKTKRKIEIKYDQNIALRISMKGIKDNAYIDFYAHDNGRLFDSFGLTNIHCGRVNISESIFQKIWKAYPKPYKIPPCSDGFQDQCAIRMSVALRGAGFELKNVENKTNPKGQTYCSHGDVLGAYNLSEYLDERKFFGSSVLYDGTKQNVKQILNNKTGILFFENYKSRNSRSHQNRHIEVWNGKKLVSPYDDQMFDSTIIKFWEVK